MRLSLIYLTWLLVKRREGEAVMNRPSSCISNAFTCSGAYAVLIMSGLKRVENRSMMPVPAKGRCAMSTPIPCRGNVGMWQLLSVLAAKIR